MSDILPANPGAGYQAIRSEILATVEEVLDSGYYILGEIVLGFEREFAAWMGGGHCVGVGNGTDALELCIRALEVGEGDLVALPTHTAVATATAVVRAGAIPLLVDIDAETFLLDYGKLEEAIAAVARRERVAAVIPVHLYGQCCDMTQLNALAERHNFAIIEDCSQAHGSMWRGEKVGRYGAAAAFSCYPTKNLGALGDAGLAYSRDSVTADRIRQLRQYGWASRYVSEDFGMNSRLDELQAAILSLFLKCLDARNDRRRDIAARYRQGLAGTPLHLPKSSCSLEGHVYHQFTVRLEDRDRMLEHLLGRNVIPSILYPKPIHLQPAYREFADRFPLPRDKSKLVCGELLCLPIYPELADESVDRVIEAVRSFYQ